jgi:serine/threonine protein kinase
MRPGPPSDRFELRSPPIGEGSHGIVYRAHDRNLGCDVALKMLRDRSADGLHDLKREFRRFAEIHHPNLTRLHELVIDDDAAFFTMELIDGLDFVQHVRQRSSFDFDAFRNCAVQLADAIHAIHAAGLVHRDLKPMNILVTREGRVVVLDFGIAATIDPASLTSTASDAFAGTLAYMAPECLEGRRATAESDWYSAGIVLYEALTGARPFSGHVMQMVAAKKQGWFRRLSNIPVEIADIVNALIEPLPPLRPRHEQVRAGLQANRDKPFVFLPPPATEARFVGREVELARLHELHASRGSSGCTMVLASGASGIGSACSGPGSA